MAAAVRPLTLALGLLLAGRACGQLRASPPPLDNSADQNAEELLCPDKKANLPFFTLPCRSNQDCKILGEQCCNIDGRMRCHRGVPKPKPEPTHQPFLGVVPRECPVHPLPEPLQIRNCTDDSDCRPRICCPEGKASYCRTPLPKWDEVPRLEPLRNILEYLQCTPPPSPFFDLFPKPCQTIVDCFPNLCCQEKGRKVCRPPKKSMLALLARLPRG